jgi:hypothetical protein
LVAAAGNTASQGATACYPASFDKLTLAVATMGCDGTREQGFWGGTSAPAAPWIDLAAPGSADDPTGNGGEDQVVTTEMGGGFTLSEYFGGTSAAIPHVGGAAGLLASHTSILTNEDLGEVLTRTAMNMDSLGNGGNYGHGLLRADSALALVDSFLVAHGAATSIDSCTLVDSCVVRRFKNITLANETTEAPDFESYFCTMALVKIYRFETTVELTENTNPEHIPPMWVRGRGSISARYLTHPLDRYDGYREPYYGEVISISSGTATLRGWTYQLWSPNGGCAGVSGDTLWGWFPLQLPVTGPLTIFSYTYLADTTSTGDGRGARTDNLDSPVTVLEDNAGLHFLYTGTNAGNAKLHVFDLTGRLVRTLAANRQTSMVGEVIWDKRSTSGYRVPSGIYLGRLEVGDDKRQIRLLVVR